MTLWRAGEPSIAVCAPVRPSRKAVSVPMSGNGNVSVQTGTSSDDYATLTFHQEALSFALSGFIFQATVSG
ncbi:MAG: hypothetical protein PHD43_13550 [Methylococcales bacterium]|nr:hypothetical protein [Methylococcales bacterium]